VIIKDSLRGKEMVMKMMDMIADNVIVKHRVKVREELNIKKINLILKKKPNYNQMTMYTPQVMIMAPLRKMRTIKQKIYKHNYQIVRLMRL
jgi:hypothetical protein